MNRAHLFYLSRAASRRLSSPWPMFRLQQLSQSKAPIHPQSRCINTIPTATSPLDSIPLSSTPLPPSLSHHRNSTDDHHATQPPLQVYSFPPPDRWHENQLLMQGCESDTRLKVAVLLSGGVDSSLALRLLLAAGHDCTAFYLQIWFQEDFRNTWDSCPWEEDLGFAKAVCESLGVPLEVVPLTNAYWDKVVSHSVQEIRDGRTPNPDMLCNSRVKFGAFYDYLDEKHGGEFDRVASGHYARVVRDKTSSSSGHYARVVRDKTSSSSSSSSLSSSSLAPRVRLAMTPDTVKDQTYFLAHLSPKQLSKTMFPLGPLTKPMVRQLASLADLANKERKDSQGICFLGKVKFTEFVKEHLGEWQGLIVEHETGKVLGMHQGYWFYTVGQRSGIKLGGGPWYVVRKDRDLNVVYASRSYRDDEADGDVLEEEEGGTRRRRRKRRDTFETDAINWVSDLRLRLNDPLHPVMVKVRHGPNIYTCKEIEVRGGDGDGDGDGDGCEGGTRVVIEGEDQGLAPGQYAVFYQEGFCLGSAKIV